MARDDEKRKNFWDDDEDETSTQVQTKKSAGPSATDSEVIDKKIHEARVLMEQTHQLYQNFFLGFEKRTPIEKVKLLESKIGDLQRTGTNLTTARFKISQFLAQYTSMKELWERKLRDRERK